MGTVSGYSRYDHSAFSFGHDRLLRFTYIIVTKWSLQEIEGPSDVGPC